jgi:hypothetical protein
MHTMQARAQELVDFGWAVLPLHGVIHDRKGVAHCTCSHPSKCNSPAKHPRTPQGLKNASKDAISLRAWWGKWPMANVGVSTGLISGIVVLDIDPKNGGEDSFDNLMVEHGRLPDTAEVLTGGGGRHLYFKHPGRELKNSAGLIGPGLDIRGDGGYVVGPGSHHISGGTYDWEASSTPELAGVAHMPQWLIDMAMSSGQAASTQVAMGEDGFVIEGSRNVWLTRIGGYMRRQGTPERQIFNALMCLNEVCLPQLDNDEVAKIAKSVARYAPAVQIRRDRKPGEDDAV